MYTPKLYTCLQNKNKRTKKGGGVGVGGGGGGQSEHITDKAQESKLLNAEIICKNGLQCSSIQQAIQTIQKTYMYANTETKSMTLLTQI